MQTLLLARWGVAVRATARRPVAGAIAVLDSALGISAAFGADWQIVLQGSWCCLSGRLDALRSTVRRHAALLMRRPAPVPRGIPPADLAMPAVAVALPADLLRRRPDLWRAERTLTAALSVLAATGDSGLPVLRLSGAARARRPSSGAPLYGPAVLWQIGAAPTAAVAEDGRIRRSPTRRQPGAIKPFIDTKTRRTPCLPARKMRRVRWRACASRPSRTIPAWSRRQQRAR